LTGVEGNGKRQGGNCRKERGGTIGCFASSLERRGKEGVHHPDRKAFQGIAPRETGNHAYDIMENLIEKLLIGREKRGTVGGRSRLLGRKSECFQKASIQSHFHVT